MSECKVFTRNECDAMRGVEGKLASALFQVKLLRGNCPDSELYAIDHLGHAIAMLNDSEQALAELKFALIATRMARGDQSVKAADRKPVASQEPKISRMMMLSEMAARCLIFALLLFPALLSAQLPEAPAPKLDRIERVELSADIAARGLDLYSTTWSISRGGQERFLPNGIAAHGPRLALFEAGMCGLDYSATRWLNAHGHRRVARIVAGADAVSTGFFAARNFTGWSKQ